MAVAHYATCALLYLEGSYDLVFVSSPSPLAATQAARPPLPTSGMAALSTLIRQCWDADAQKRPEFKDIVLILKKLRRDLAEDPSSIAWIESAPDQPVGCMVRAESALELLELAEKKGKRWRIFGRMSETFNYLGTKS